MAAAVSSIENTLFPSASPTRISTWPNRSSPRSAAIKAELGVLDITKWFGETSGGVAPICCRRRDMSKRGHRSGTSS